MPEHSATATMAAPNRARVRHHADGAPRIGLPAPAGNDLAATPDCETLAEQLCASDTLLRELQHRVKNSLQMITSLIRLESHCLPEGVVSDRFDRLAGRVESVALLYRSLDDAAAGDSIDMGAYLRRVASAVMQAHEDQGIRLDLHLDTFPVSAEVAMATGLMVNELLTNALKYAFAGRDGGTITLRSLVDATGCQVIVADDGVGLAEGAAWPTLGKMSALIVQSLQQQGGARVAVASAPNQGTCVTISYPRDGAEAP
ncbi:two-component sensor histidine kinase [Humitalea rosea]|uniref:histidine kinase n=1 Tax=Humitalea rosea TaxID=990373 RepID=A0A2W7IAM6_9PROT|nr:sensor histidine kinase [Humitalea rosea]PZW43158.1 two-component sensor histidine kinase [Humitalea rosea]